MVKGVNKKIIEVNNPDSIYFEKAVFYLKPEVQRLPDEVSEREIERYIRKIIPETDYRKNKIKKGRIIIYTAIVLMIILLVVFILI